MTTTCPRLAAAVSVFFLILAAGCSFGGRKPSGPVITSHSDVYLVGGVWHCPLCDEPVANSDRSSLNPALSLSEWHDVTLDSVYFEHSIRTISTEALVRALAIPVPDHADTAAHLHRYFVRRADNGRLYTYDTEPQPAFVSIPDFRRAVSRDAARRSAILDAAKATASPDSGYAIASVRFGAKVDFNADWPDASPYGVHYCGFLPDLLNEFMITGEEFHRAALEDLFNQWYDQRDHVTIRLAPGMTKAYDVIWYELGLGVRLPRVIDAFRVLRGSVSPETSVRMLKTILGSSRWLYQCLTRTPFHPYNWQVQTATSLAYAGILFPEFREAAEWVEAGRENMELHFTRDILDDGGYVERTGSYTRYVFEMFSRTMTMFQVMAGDSRLVDAYRPRLERLMEFSAYTITPVGLTAPFNDCARETRIAELLLMTGKTFGRPDFVGAARHGLTQEHLAAAGMAPAIPTVRSLVFPHSKFAVMRSDWDRDAYYMIINYGPLANHGHYGILDFEAYANGIPLALDAGISPRGYLDSLHVPWYKNTEAHNMLTVNGATVNRRGIEGEDLLWSSLPTTDVFAATQRGYEEYQNTTTRRHIVFVKKEYWVVLDEVRTDGEERVLDWNLHTPSAMIEHALGFVSTGRPGFGLLLPGELLQRWSRVQRAGPADLRGLPGEPESREIDWVTFRRTAAGRPEEDRICVVLFPLGADAGDSAVPEVSLLRVEDPRVFGVQVRRGESVDHILFSDGEDRKFLPGLRGNFRAAVIRHSQRGVESAAVTGGSRVTGTLLPAKEFPERQDWEFSARQ